MDFSYKRSEKSACMLTKGPFMSPIPGTGRGKKMKVSILC